jgi:hypothetical protein
LLLLAAWRIYLGIGINRQLAAIRADGLPTSGEELNRWYAAVPDDQNAALVLTQAFELRRNYADSRSNLIHNFKLPKRAEALSSEQVESLKGYVAMNDPMLAKADEAVRLPASRYPIDCSLLMNTLLPHLAWLKNLAEVHQFTAYLATQSGHPERATINIIAMLALARTLDNEPCLISQLVKVKLVEMAFATLERRANSGAFSDTELTGLAGGFAQTRMTNIVVMGLIGERAMMIPYFRMSRTEATRIHPPKDEHDSKSDSPLPCYGPFILKVIGYYELDFGTFLYGMKRGIAKAGQTPPENLRANAYFAYAGEASTKHRRTISGLIMSSYAGSLWRENDGIARQRLALTALALESFRNKTGSLPDELEKLVPDYLEEVPEDSFTGLELESRRTEKGHVIYSVGRDREDNGGLEQSAKSQSDDKGSYDITFIVER